MPQGKVSDGSILDELNLLIKPLISQKCWQIKRSYGGAYNLDIGAKISFGKSFVGEFYINTCGTNFILTSPKIDNAIDTRNLDTEDPDIIKLLTDALGKLEGHSIITIKVGYENLELFVKFDNDVTFTITPMFEDDEYDELPYWSIKLPDNKFLAVGKDRIYSITKKSNQ